MTSHTPQKTHKTLTRMMALTCASAQPSPASAQRPRRGNSRSQSVLRQLMQLISTTELGQSGAVLDQPTAECVAQLFHAILKEDGLSPLLRVWFARLQWPVTRLAAVDTVGFQDPDHPARRLLGLLASHALGLADVALPCGALEQELKRLVTLIEQPATPDRAVFETACLEFETFLRQSGGPAAAHAKVDCAVCQHDQRQALTTQYQLAIQDTLGVAPVQAEIRDFLHHVWAEVLALQAIQKGLEHGATLALKRVAVDLIQINTALHHRHERRRAMGKVPQLVDKLRQGMALLGLPQDTQDHHIKNIGNNLTDAFLSEQHQFQSVHHAIKLERKAAKRATNSDLDGLHVIDADAESAWRLWECALADQDTAPTADENINATGQETVAVANTLDFWETYTEVRS